MVPSQRPLIQDIRPILRMKKQEIRVVVLGLQNAGKTTLLNSLSKQDVHTVSPLADFHYKCLNLDNLKLVCWDFHVENAQKHYYKSLYCDKDAIMIVIDSVGSKQYLKQVRLMILSLVEEKKFNRVPILFMANKQQLITAKDPQQILNELNIVSELGDRRWTIVACSAKTQQGVQDGFVWLQENVIK